MTHVDFVQEVLKEWNLGLGKMNQSCYCQWYHYTIPSGEPFPEDAREFCKDGKHIFLGRVRGRLPSSCINFLCTDNWFNRNF